MTEMAESPATEADHEYQTIPRAQAKACAIT